jgi:hypothetical protein
MKLRRVAILSFVVLGLLWGLPAMGQEIFIGNPGRA